MFFSKKYKDQDGNLSQTETQKIYFLLKKLEEDRKLTRQNCLEKNEEIKEGRGRGMRQKEGKGKSYKKGGCYILPVQYIPLHCILSNWHYKVVLHPRKN